MLNVLLAILLGLIALLAIPVTLSFRVAWRQAFNNDIRLQWAFGLVRAGIPTAGTGARKVGKETPDRKPSSAGKYRVLAAIRLKRFRRRMIRFIGDLWRAVHKQDVRLNLRVGLGDPADTGRLWAVLGPVAGMLADVRGASIRVDPEFFDATFELDSSGIIRIIPLRMVYLIAALLLSPAAWQGYRLMRTARS